MRTIWNGSINFGLVNIPIGLAVAQQRKDVSFRTLHRECGGRVEGDGVTIYLACGDYPIRCDNELGARFQLDDGGRFLASPPASGEYAGLSIFADRGNTRSTLLTGDVTLTGAVYTASSRLRVFSASKVRINSLLVVDRLQSINLDPLEVNYNPSVPLPGVGVPVLIQ